ncbi:MAG: ATP-binding cassette domain-containing protein, partial [Desulfobacterales bacterium]|nr:ATP-binding cassette domain-containing protein [Desulfobacterales bacterium]
MSETILKAEGVDAFIDQHHILQGISFEAKADGVTVLIGRNGAGKSSTLRTVMGLIPVAKGKIFFKGGEIQNKKPHRIARMGIGFVPEHMGIFSDLTVEENMQVAMLKDDDATARRLDMALTMFTDLKKFWLTKAGNLSGGQKQMLSIARAIVNDISLLLIDEPTKGLAPIIIDALID